jgi:hypothetical protein
MVVAAIFGIPIIIDPPPRNPIVQTGRADGRDRPKRGRRRS